MWENSIVSAAEAKLTAEKQLKRVAEFHINNINRAIKDSASKGLFATSIRLEGGDSSLIIDLLKESGFDVVAKEVGLNGQYKLIIRWGDIPVVEAVPPEYPSVPDGGETPSDPPVENIGENEQPV